MIAIPYSKFQVDSARWHSSSKERRQDNVHKLRGYCLTPADFYPKSRNTAPKPAYSTWERHENPAVIFNRNNEDKEIHPAGSSMYQVENFEQGLRFLIHARYPRKPSSCI